MIMTVPRKRVKKSPAAVSLESEYSAFINAQSFNHLLMSEPHPLKQCDYARHSRPHEISLTALLPGSLSCAPH